MNIDYPLIDDRVNEFQQYDHVIKKIKKRVQTYGYQRIKTSAFENYDLYSQVNSSVNKSEMIKVIDYTGDVLVLRPDVTIPITRTLVEDGFSQKDEARYFYIQDVFRQPFDRIERIESTQAGVEYFGNRSPEADAEVIALACQILMDLGFEDVKIEIGHAGFFQALIQQVDLTDHEFKELKQIIQAKNVVEIQPFLEKVNIDERIAEAIEKIPFLYGNPLEVTKRAKDLQLPKSLLEKLDHLIEVYKIMSMYGLEDNVIMDIGLINHMGYYSDIIFQGFVENLGQPVLMGGRYDQLANIFGSSFPAIGFACEVELILEALDFTDEKLQVNDEIQLFYEKDVMKQAIRLTSILREKGHQITTKRNLEDKDLDAEKTTIIMTRDEKNIYINGEQKSFKNHNELFSLLEGGP